MYRIFGACPQNAETSYAPTDTQKPIATSTTTEVHPQGWRITPSNPLDLKAIFQLEQDTTAYLRGEIERDYAIERDYRFRLNRAAE